MPDNILTGFSRVFTIEDGAGPANVPVYEGQARAMGPSYSFGGRTPVREPDPNRYNAWRIVDTIKGAADLPTLSIENRYQYTVSSLFALGRRGCPLDIQVHFGKCQDPRDFSMGYDKILVLEGADITNWAAGELGALDQDQNAVVNETIDASGLDMYEIVPLVMAEFGEAEVDGEVVAVVVCDSIQCGACGVPSDGCQVVFAITITQQGSPGLGGELIYSEDAWATLQETNVLTLGPAEDPSDMACVGTRLVVISNNQVANGLHYATIADILAENEVWVKAIAGFVAAGNPNAIFSLGSAHTWIVGDAGYVYFTADVTAGVTVQDAGIAADTDNLNDIHGIDDQNLVAVGDDNTVIVTGNGGETWAGIDGPAGGVALNCVWMKSELEWFIGDAGGNLWYTRDGGVTWLPKDFPGDNAGQVRDIQFATPTVGYMAHDIVGPAGRVLRTVDGGYSWYVLPETTGEMPENDRINSVAACGEDVNVVFAGGLDGAGVDGILVKGA